jgi:DNA repair protein RadC
VKNKVQLERKTNPRRLERQHRKRSAPHAREIKVVTVREEPAEFDRYGKMNEPKHVFEFWKTAVVRSSWYQEDKEQLVCFCLDAKYRLKSFCLVSIGSLNEAIAHPREVFRPAIAEAAYAVILAHNHPSGEPSLSTADMATANRLYWAAELLQISLLDFIAIGERDYFGVAGSRNWPPVKSPLATDYTLNSQDLPPVDRRRFTRIYATQNQWSVIKYHVDHGDRDRLLLSFLATCSPSQLRRLRASTPFFFDASNPPGYFVAVRDFRATETRDWKQAKFYRYLIARELSRRRQLAASKGLT